MRRRDNLYRRTNRGAEFFFRWKDTDGIWHEKNTGTRDRAIAKKFRTRFLEEYEAGTLPTDKADWTVKQACELWVGQHAARLTSVRARSNEQSYLRQLLARLGNRRLNTITLDVLKNYQRDRSKTVKGRPINLELAILVAVLKEENLWKGNLLKYHRLPESDGEVGTALTMDQLKHLEKVASSKDNWMVAYNCTIITANTGLRGAEIKRMKLGAIDLAKRAATVHRNTTKSRKGFRIVELNLAATIAFHRLMKRAEVLGATSEDHYLLPADLSRHTKKCDPHKGKRGFDPTDHQISWTTAWRNLRKAAGLPKLRFHDLRHTFITQNAEQGVPLPVTQDLVGHMNEATTKIYTHISDTAKRAAVEKIQHLRDQHDFADGFADSLADNVKTDSTSARKVLQ